ncbi:hypothetical protein SLE2022_327590 [Rubroshorea leprosula]
MARSRRNLTPIQLPASSDFTLVHHPVSDGVASSPSVEMLRAKLSAEVKAVTGNLASPTANPGPSSSSAVPTVSSIGAPTAASPTVSTSWADVVANNFDSGTLSYHPPE